MTSLSGLLSSLWATACGRSNNLLDDEPLFLPQQRDRAGQANKQFVEDMFEEQATALRDHNCVHPMRLWIPRRGPSMFTVWQHQSDPLIGFTCGGCGFEWPVRETGYTE